MNVAIIIKHIKGLPNFILKNGEMCFIEDKNVFYIGDGINKTSDLKPFNNLVKGDNGKIYAVSVDKEGIPFATEVKLYTEKVSGTFYAETPNNEVK